MNNTPTITPFQLETLCKTAQAKAPIFLVALPNHSDGFCKRVQLAIRRYDINKLVSLGFMEDVSDEFSDILREYTEATGRDYSVFGMTEVGYALFKDSRSINLTN